MAQNFLSDIKLGDNIYIRLGDSTNPDGDLQIYHDGNQSFITDAGTGNLRIQGTNLALQNAAGTKNYFFAADGGAAILYHNNSEALKTAINGVEVVSNLGVGRYPSPIYGIYQEFNATDANTDNKFAYFIDGNFSGADNTDGDREQGGIRIDIDSSADGDGSDEHRLYGVWSDVRFTGYSDLVRAGYFYAENNMVTGSEQQQETVGVYASAVGDGTSSTAGTNNLKAVQGQASVQNAGYVNASYGGFFQSFLSSTRSIDTNHIVGVRGEVEIDSTNSITLGNARAVQAIVDIDSTTPTITNSFLYYGGYEGDTSNISNKYGIYLLGSDITNRLDGVTLFQGGSESAPSIARLGTTSTGIYFPGSNTIGITTGGSDAITIANNNVTFSGDVTVDGGDFNLTKQNAAPVITMLHDGNNPSTNTLLHHLDFQVDYAGNHQSWGSIQHKTTGTDTRTQMIFNVKSQSGNVMDALTLTGGSGEPSASFAGDVNVPSGYVGRDTHNGIHFSTDDSIIFRVADTHRARFDSDALKPYADSSYDLGTNTVRFANIYADTLYGDGSNLTGIIDGSGTAGRIPKFSDSNTLADSRIFESTTGTYIHDSDSTTPLQVTKGGTTFVKFVGLSTINNSYIEIPPGTEAIPAINFGRRHSTGAVDTDTGIYSSAANHIEIATGGSKALGINSSQNATFAGNVTIDKADPTLTLESNRTTIASGNTEILGQIDFKTNEGSFLNGPAVSARIRVDETEYAATTMSFWTSTNPDDTLVKQLEINPSGLATFTGNVTVTGDFQVNGTTTTVNATNLDLSDNIIGLNRGANSNSNDSGIIIERGNTGDNAAMIWDEANDRFVFGLTTSTPAATGSVSISSTSNLAARDLDVNTITSAAITASGDITLDDNSGASPSLYLYNGDNNYWRIFNGSSLDLTFRVGTVTKFNIDSSGNATLSDGTAKKLSILASTHNTNVANTATLELGYGHSGGSGFGNIVLTEDANNSFGADMTFGVPHNNGSGGSATRTALTLDGGTLAATFEGDVRINGNDLEFSGAAAKISGTSGGQISLNYNTTSNQPLIWYGGGTSEQFKVTNTGNATFAGTVTGGNGSFTNLTINAGERLRLDGAGGHTHLQEISDDRLGITAGNRLMLDLGENGDSSYIDMHAPTVSIHSDTAGMTPTFQVKNTNADANPPRISLIKDSASPADNDETGRIYMYGDNDNSEQIESVLIRGMMTDVSDGSEDSSLEFFTYAAGSQNTTLHLSSGNVGIGTGGSHPTYKLQVQGPGYFNETVYINGGTTVDDDLIVSGSGRVLVQTDTTTPTGGDAVFYKSSAGAVVSGYQAILETGSAGSRATALTINNSQIPTFVNATASGTAMYIHNTTDSIADTKTLIDFRAQASNNSTFYVSGQMGSKAEGTWTSTSSTRDASLIFNTVLNGNNELALTLASNKTATFAGKVHVGSGTPNGFIDVHADNGNWRVNSYGAMYFRNSSNATHESYIHSRSDGSLSIGRVAESNWTGSGAGAYATTTYDHVKFDTSSNATFKGQLIIESIYPTILLTDTNHNDDWGIYNNNGKFLVYNQTDAVNSFEIDQSNNATFEGDVNVKNAGTRLISLNYEDSVNSIISHNGTNFGLENLNVRGDNIYFYTDYDSGTPKGNLTLTLDSSHNATFANLVTLGPGTTGSPYDSTTFLHVKGTTRSIVQQSSTTDAYYMFGDAAANNVGWFGYNHTYGNANIQAENTITLYKPTNVVGTFAASDDFTLDNSSPEMYFKTGSTHYNWMIAAQENVDTALEFTPSNAVGTSGTHDTPALTLYANRNAVFAGTVTVGSDITATGADFTLAHAAGATMFIRRDDTSISDGDVIGLLNFQGDDPSDGTFNTGAAIKAVADGTWQSSQYPAELLFQTRNQTGSLATSLTLNKDQSATFAAKGIFNDSARVANNKYFEGTHSNGSTALRMIGIDNNGDMFMGGIDGNVGNVTIRDGSGNNTIVLASNNATFAAHVDAGGRVASLAGSSQVQLTEYNNGAAIWLDGSDGDLAGGDYFGIHAYGTTDLAFSYGAATKITMKNDGKLGIGTDSPATKLNVVDSTALTAQFSGYSHASSSNNARAASGSIRLGNGAGNTGFLIDYTDQGQTVALIKNEYVATATSELRLQSPFISLYTGTSPSEKLRIDPSGRFFLGHTSTLLSSSEKFSVSAGTNGINVFQNSSTGNGTLYLSNTNTSTTDWQTYLIFQDGTGNRGQMGVFYNDSKLGVSGHGGIAFKTGATSLASATTRLTITSSGLSEFEGDVKISKSTPVLTFNNLAGGGLDPILTATGTNFTISTSSITPFSLALDDGTLTLDPGQAGKKPLKLVGNYSSSGDVKILEFVRVGDAVAGAIEYNDATTDMEIGTVTNHAFSIKTNDTRAISINNSQKATFLGDAHVVGEFAVIGSNGNSNNRLKATYNGTSGVAVFGPHSTGGSTSLEIGTSNSGTYGTALTINSTGEVKIGKSIHLGSDSTVVTPAQYSMLIEAPSGSETNLNMYTHGASIFNINSDGTAAKIGWGSSQTRKVNLVNTGTGVIQVGIGTTSPSSTLHVDGATKLTGGTLQVSTDSSLTSNYSYTFRDAVGINNPNSTSAATSANTVMAIGGKSGGSINTSLITTAAVGIGTDSPSSQLHVYGANTVGRFVSSTAYVDLIFLNSGGTGGFLNFVNNTAFNLYVGGGSGSDLKMSVTNGGLLTVTGDVVAFGSPSDASLKENVKPIDNALDKVSKLKGVTFDWKKSDSILEIKEDIGFIAQDVQEVLPELVRENDNGKLSLRDKGIVPVLVEAIKELKAEIEELKCKCDGCTK